MRVVPSGERVVIPHVQVAGPRGWEPETRAFYTRVLGRTELSKPPSLAAQGGCRFAVTGDGELHLGIEDGFHPSAKAHPAFAVDVDDAAARLEAAGRGPSWVDPAEIPGRRRLHITDPVGNRLEFLEP